MATINLNSIQDFFEAGYNYCSSKIREITPIIPYSYLNIKQLFYFFNQARELEEATILTPSKHFKKIPGYAITNHNHAKVFMNDKYDELKISNGVYYIVLVDLVGSTKYLASHGNEKAAARIISFVQAGVETFINCEKVNKAYFLKEVGDSVLFIFSHVIDVVNWYEALNKALEQRSALHEEAFEIRTCVHIGEVSLHDDNPLCLSVSETFKMEKLIGAGKIVFSEAAAGVAAPSLNRSKYKLKAYRENSLVQPMQELINVNDIKKAPS
jgi:hypothetical protein